MRGLPIAIVALVIGSACGGGSDSGAAKSPATYPNVPASTGGSTSNPDNTSHQVPTTQTSQPPGPPIQAAMNDVRRAQGELDAAGADCGLACRALTSLERATNHLCELDSGAECANAQAKLAAARDRVKRACGVCR